MTAAPSPTVAAVEEAVARLVIAKIIPADTVVIARACGVLGITQAGMRDATVRARRKRPTWVAQQEPLSDTPHQYNSGPKPEDRATVAAETATETTTTSTKTKTKKAKSSAKASTSRTGRVDKPTGYQPRQAGEPETKNCGGCGLDLPVDVFALTKKGKRSDGTYRISRDYLHRECRLAYQRQRYLTKDTVEALNKVGLVFDADRELVCSVCEGSIQPGEQAVAEPTSVAHVACAAQHQHHPEQEVVL